MTGFLAYRWVVTKLETRFLKTHGEPIPAYRVAIQWLTTAYLWSQWLIQDLANIFVYMPRSLSFENLMLCLAVMLGLHAWIFYRRGGEIQHIVTSKTNTFDIRSAAFINDPAGPCYSSSKKPATCP